MWRACTDVGSYRAWWPWLVGFDGSAFGAGERWSCAVQPPFPYRLRFDIQLDEVDPPRSVTASVGGDIVGSARLTIGAAGDGGTEARLVSDLAPANAVLRHVASVARPIVRLGHDWVLDTGAAQFRRNAFRSPTVGQRERHA